MIIGIKKLDFLNCCSVLLNFPLFIFCQILNDIGLLKTLPFTSKATTFVMYFSFSCNRLIENEDD